MFKLLRSRRHRAALDGRHRPRQRRPGAGRASLGLETTADGVDWLLAPGPELPDLVFEATSAYAHRANAPLLRRGRHRAIDLTPAAIGPYVVPAGEPREHLDALERQHGHLRRPGHDPDGRRRVAGSQPVPYAEIVATVASRRPARARGRTSTSSPAPPPARVSRLGGAARGQGDHHPQPGRAAADHARHDLLRDAPPTRTRTRSPRRSSDGRRGRRRTCPATGCRRTAVRPVTRRHGRRVAIFLEVEGAGDYLPPYAGNLDIMTAAAAARSARRSPGPASTGGQHRRRHGVRRRRAVSSA